MERLLENKLGTFVNIRLGFSCNASKVLDSSNRKELIVKKRDLFKNYKRTPWQSIKTTETITIKRLVKMALYSGKSATRYKIERQKIRGRNRSHTHKL